MAQWYYSCDGKRCGPVEEPDLVKKIRDGAVKPTDLVWNESLGDKWAAASTIPALCRPAEEKTSPVPDAETKTTPPERRVVMASYESVPDNPASSPKGFPGGSFLFRVVLPVALLVGAGLVYQRHSDTKKEAEEQKIRAIADAKRSAYLSTPKGYIADMLTHDLQLRFLTDFESPDKSGLYVFGWILNKGDTRLSSVQIRVTSGDLTQSISLGPIKANGQSTFDQKITDPGFGQNALYTVEMHDVTF
jgi:hypothetical protein